MTQHAQKIHRPTPSRSLRLRMSAAVRRCGGAPVIGRVAASLTLCVLLGILPARAQDISTGKIDTAARGQAVEMHLPPDQTPTPWLLDPSVFDEDAGDRVETTQVVAPDVTTVKLNNLVPPIRFPLGKAEIPANYLQVLQGVLDSMRDRTNVRLHLVGHADNLPLSEELQAIFGDNIGLSRERAGTTAEYFQQRLNLPPEAISYEGLGDSQPIASNETESGRQMNRRVEVEVWYDEIGQKQVDQEVIVPHEVNRVKVCRTETVCKLRYLEGHAHRARIKNLVAPLHYQQGLLPVTETFVQQLRQNLEHLRHKQNLVLKFTAYTDNTPLVGREKRIYGDHGGFSKAVARRVALAVQEALDLDDDAVESRGKGAAYPVASNDTERGRALNRRVEVEFWYDDPLQQLPDEPQLCPDDAGAEIVTRVYDPPNGGLEPIRFANGQPVLTPAYIERLSQVMAEVKDKTNVRLRFVGYTNNERLDRRTAMVYGDDIGWSTARARRVMTTLRQEMALTEKQAECEGRGYVQSNDVINAGFTTTETSYVQVQVVYDELAVLDNYEGVEVTRMTREVELANPFGLNLMRITVDGKPVDDPGLSSPDVQRCTDVELEKARILFKHDNLKLEPRLNVTAWPRAIRHQDIEETDFVENRVHFRLYTNYRHFIQRAEVRVFRDEQSDRDTPLAIIAMDDEGRAQWQPEFDNYSALDTPLKYLVRVYNDQGQFDETRPQPLWVVEQLDPTVLSADLQQELLVGYGESRISHQNIPVHGGSVQAQGDAIPEGHDVWLAGQPVPVDAEGRFIAEQILPEGIHTVEVAVLDNAGNGELFLRDLALNQSDWFTVGIADLTFAANRTKGPATLLAPDRSQYSDDLDLQGRLAFYSKGKFGNGWKLTASADTREGPFDEIFSNFLDKSPEALFRRLDTDRYYPTFGDDSTVVEDAPTLGKFYLRLQKDADYALWGNFKIGYTDSYLAQVDRGLYGANLHLQARETTSFGEQRFLIDGFAAEPGTIGGRDEFRGTGGSLYFLQKQDILQGSERVRIEIRDKDSGLVVGSKSLSPELDYTIDYLQGRVLLSEPLSGTADDNLLVQNGSFSGDPVFLVVRYEFTPSFDEMDSLATGGRLHYWLNDHVKLGVTANHEAGLDDDNTLTATDVTLRKSADTWLRLEAGRTEGPGVLTTTSVDGGFDFSTETGLTDTTAFGQRVDASIGLNDFFEGRSDRLSVYYQGLEAGYASPGLATDSDLTQYGGRADIAVTDQIGLRLKADRRQKDEGLETIAGEANVDYRLNKHWTLSSGVRHDRREDNAVDVLATQQEGDRTDMVAQVQYDSRERWSSYGFVQETLRTTGDRDDNARVGAGGNYQVSDRLKVNGEVSTGDAGIGAKAGTEYLYSDRTTLYFNYGLENERSDTGVRARKGNLISGFRTRFSDSASVYLEEKYTHGDVPTGLLHSTGVELSPTDRLNLAANLDLGTLEDFETGAETERKAVGVSVGYGFDRLKLSSAVEFRRDDTENALTGSRSDRTSWLFKNNARYQISPDWRFIGKLNYSQSESSLGESFDGNFTEAVIGYAYRPVHNDRLNALIKYTFYTNDPASEQLVNNVAETTSNVGQRSHIGAVDVMYDLTKKWTVGGKYAYRHGEVSSGGSDDDYFSSRAHLYVVRADWKFLPRWETLMEARLLDLPDAEEQRTGALLAIYRQFGDHIKLGVGYNFSEFSDDLTELDYQHQGLFFNLIGMM